MTFYERMVFSLYPEYSTEKNSIMSKTDYTLRHGILYIQETYTCLGGVFVLIISPHIREESH